MDRSEAEGHWTSSTSWARPTAFEMSRRLNGENDLVLVVVEFQDYLDVGQLIGNAEVDGSGGAEKIHRFSATGNPSTNIFEIEPGFFLLKKYSHTLPAAPHQSFPASPKLPRHKTPPRTLRRRN